MNKHYDDIDNIIFTSFKNDIDIPISTQQVIANALYSEAAIENSKFNIVELIRKIIFTIISILGLTGSIVFADEIGIFLDNIFNNNTGITTAINNGYINSPDMNYSESNGIKIKTDYILMDDYNLNISFDINLDNTDFKVEDINSISFDKYIIYDENNTVLLYNDKDTIIEILSNNNKTFNPTEFDDNAINSALNYFIKDSNIEDNSIDLIYNISPSESIYPKSKTLYIEISDLIIETVDSSELISGYWHLEISLPESFYNRETIEYVQKSSNDDNIVLDYAYLTDTGLNFSIHINEIEKFENDSLTALRSDVIEYKTNYDNEIKQLLLNYKNSSHELIDSLILINNNSENFSSSTIFNEFDYLYYNTSDKTTVYQDTFDITKHDLTDELHISFVINNEEKIINLIKK